MVSRKRVKQPLYNVLCLGMSYANVEQQLESEGVCMSKIIHKTTSVEQTVELVRRQVLTEMDGRDLARCQAMEEHCQVKAYTISQEKGATYAANHLHGNFNRRSFLKEIKRKWGDRINFRQIILDYFWIPPGSWVMHHWGASFFKDTLPAFVEEGLLEPGKGVIYLPFCLHCVQNLVALEKHLSKFYKISFVHKADLKENDLWRGTSKICPSTMQQWLGKQLDQEELYCTFTQKDVNQAIDNQHVTKAELVSILVRIDNFADIRMIRLKPLENYTPHLLSKRHRKSKKNLVGGFVGLTSPSKVRRSFIGYQQKSDSDAMETEDESTTQSFSESSTEGVERRRSRKDLVKNRQDDNTNDIDQKTDGAQSNEMLDLVGCAVHTSTGFDLILQAERVNEYNRSLERGLARNYENLGKEDNSEEIVEFVRHSSRQSSSSKARKRKCPKGRKKSRSQWPSPTYEAMRAQEHWKRFRIYADDPCFDESSIDESVSEESFDTFTGQIPCTPSREPLDIVDKQEEADLEKPVCDQLAIKTTVDESNNEAQARSSGCNFYQLLAAMEKAKEDTGSGVLNDDQRQQENGHALLASVRTGEEEGDPSNFNTETSVVEKPQGIRTSDESMQSVVGVWNARRGRGAFVEEKELLNSKENRTPHKVAAVVTEITRENHSEHTDMLEANAGSFAETVRRARERDWPSHTVENDLCAENPAERECEPHEVVEERQMSKLGTTSKGRNKISGRNSSEASLNASLEYERLALLRAQATYHCAAEHLRGDAYGRDLAQHSGRHQDRRQLDHQPEMLRNASLQSPMQKRRKHGQSRQRDSFIYGNGDVLKNSASTEQQPFYGDYGLPSSGFAQEQGLSHSVSNPRPSHMRFPWIPHDYPLPTPRSIRIIVSLANEHFVGGACTDDRNKILKLVPPDITVAALTRDLVEGNVSWFRKVVCRSERNRPVPKRVRISFGADIVTEAVITESSRDSVGEIAVGIRLPNHNHCLGCVLSPEGNFLETLQPRAVDFYKPVKAELVTQCCSWPNLAEPTRTLSVNLTVGPSL